MFTSASCALKKPPSFDVISEVDQHELTNAVDQANRELGTRFDFKGVDAKFVLGDQVITQSAPSDFHLKQMTDMAEAVAGDGKAMDRYRTYMDQLQGRHR